MGFCKVVKTPTLVHRLAKNEVNLFAFSDKASAALVISKLVSAYPLQGPMKSFTKLTLTGCGFYPSDDIVVKFTRVGVAFMPPRSSLGKFIRDGLIECKPPKFAQEGEYEVSLAVDGVNFVPETLKIDIYAEPCLLTVTPTVADARTILTEYNGNLDMFVVCNVHICVITLRIVYL